jgi:repressor LexA
MDTAERVLALAQQTADQAIADADREADAILSKARQQEATNVPLVGQIAAGRPILAEEFIENTFPLPTQLVGQGTLFMLEVFGDSMVDAAITDGDWVVVRQQPEVENGDIVAALIGGEVTVKTFKLSDDGHKLLIPNNPAYEPLLGDDSTILGKVVAILRRIR